MRSFRPTPAEERWLTVAARLRVAESVAPVNARVGNWRHARLAMRCALFLLGVMAALMAAIVCRLLFLPHAWGVAGLALVVLAEVLIVRRRLFTCGIEEALELAGLLMLSFEFLLPRLTVLPHSGDPLGIAWYIWATFAAFAAAGLRLLNSLFTTIAILLAVLATAFTIRAPWPLPGWDRPASLLCYGLALAALAGGARVLRRPAHDRMLDWLVVAMPVAGYLWAARWPDLLPAHDYLRDHSLYALYTPLAPLALGIAALVTGVRRRTHAPLMAAMLCVACTAFELRGLTGWSLEVRLIIWGVALLLTSVAIDRLLMRQPHRGITSRRIGTGPGALDFLQLALTPALAPHAAGAPAAAVQGGGGEFGGGGASGHY